MAGNSGRPLRPLSCGVIASEEGNDVPGVFLMGKTHGKNHGTIRVCYLVCFGEKYQRCVCVLCVCVCFHQQIKIDFDRPGITEPDNLGKSWENGWKTHKGQMMEFKPTPFFGNP